MHNLGLISFYMLCTRDYYIKYHIVTVRGGIGEYLDWFELQGRAIKNPSKCRFQRFLRGFRWPEWIMMLGKERAAGEVVF